MNEIIIELFRVKGSSERSVIDDDDEGLIDDIVIQTKPADAESTSLDMSVPPPVLPPRLPRSRDSKAVASSARF
jgi:hypothetical protein